MEREGVQSFTRLDDAGHALNLARLPMIRAWRGNDPTPVLTYRRIYPDGRTQDIQSAARRVSATGDVVVTWQDITELRSATRAAETHARQQHALTDAVVAIHTAPDLAMAIHTALTHLIAGLHGAQGSIYLLDPDAATMHLVSDCGVPLAPPLRPVIQRQDFEKTWQALDTGGFPFFMLWKKKRFADGLFHNF